MVFLNSTAIHDGKERKDHPRPFCAPFQFHLNNFSAIAEPRPCALTSPYSTFNQPSPAVLA